jgi:hypothetical protein
MYGLLVLGLPFLLRYRRLPLLANFLPCQYKDGSSAGLNDTPDEKAGGFLAASRSIGFVTVASRDMASQQQQQQQQQQKQQQPARVNR